MWKGFLTASSVDKVCKGRLITPRNPAPCNWDVNLIPFLIGSGVGRNSSYDGEMVHPLQTIAYLKTTMGVRGRSRDGLGVGRTGGGGGGG